MECQAVLLAVCLVISEVSSGSINIALGKDALQSGTSDGGIADRATDGNTDGRFAHGSCTSTWSTYKPWFRVDLGETYKIQNVVIYSRTDGCCVSKLSNFSVEVTGTGNCIYAFWEGTASSMCAYHQGVADRVTNLSCNRIGRFIKIQLQKTDSLQLCEVEVYTDESTNVALRKPTEQSSTRTVGAARFSSDMAVDGLRGTCTDTVDEDPWWRVQLLHDYQIARVVIIPAMAHLVVYVDDDVCSDSDGTSSDGRTLTCGSILTGSHITIQSKGKTPLVLCEVEVYGVPNDWCEVEQSAAIWPVQQTVHAVTDVPTSTVWEDVSTQSALVTPSVNSRSDGADSTDSPQVMTSSDETLSTAADYLSSILPTSASGFPIPSSHVSVNEGEITTSLTTASKSVPASSSVKPYSNVPTLSSLSGGRTISEQCICRCKTPRPETLEDLQDSVDELQANLTVDVTNTSSYRRKRTSADDLRSSALYLGTLGIVMYVIVFAFLFLSDIMSFMNRGSPQKLTKSTTVDPGL